MLLGDSQVEDAVTATSAKHTYIVRASESVSSAVVQKSQRTQIRAWYFRGISFAAELVRCNV